ncbi:hypothetical protein J3459_013814 [Metarhizium acridum]|uniref:Aerolysin-like toxin, beta complex domain protein n=1 Tax=Metarhizium acridum (strain CQMa 102) TaxID=655827 RepID=E9E5Q4_METAQ|nr:uncharacterized protein MAC_05202 [Metarhizium acridum CQMa 102]EFY88767.1 hypothetical protein MAC_05202 [Metarhizium acridum CQMa 102]KAG8412726.1 hypothetical protein J3458_013167 [Metarhizium acridum]KAG8416055.1 hypothetical protein J3459_013814 [Metarhizium acridum]
MKTFAALSLALVSTASAQPHTARQVTADDYAVQTLNNIETGFKVNDANLPKLNVTKEWQGICIQNLNYAEQVAFFKTGTITRQNILGAKAYYIAHVETSSVNPGPGTEKSKMTISSSTTTSQVDTKGWTVGVKLTGTVGKEGVASGLVELSGTYSDTTTKTDSTTKTVTREEWCEVGYECRIETWTFHMDIHAKPRVNGNYQLWSVANQYGEEIPTCSMPKNLRSCEQFTQRFNEWCTEEKLEGGAVHIPAKFDEVHIKVPVYEANGYQTFTRIVKVFHPITKSARAEAAEPVIGTKETVLEAMKQGTKFQFLD